MKSRAFLVTALILSMGPAARSAENKYDVLGKTLTPFVQLLAAQSTTGQRALTMTLRLEAMTDLGEPWKDARAEIALEYPDKLRLRGPVFGEEVTICRDGERVWVSPRARAEALFQAAAAAKKLPPPDKKFRLEPFRLPVPEKQLVFLPVLFQVTDGGYEELGQGSSRVLDLRLMPELARSLRAENWSARLWVRRADYRPARIQLMREAWSAVIGFDEIRFAKKLPAETWHPTDVPADEVWDLSPAEYQQLLKLMGGQ